MASRRMDGPRPVVIGTVALDPTKATDPETFLNETVGMIDGMARQAEERGWKLDLAVSALGPADRLPHGFAGVSKEPPPHAPMQCLSTTPSPDLLSLFSPCARRPASRFAPPGPALQPVNRTPSSLSVAFEME